MVYRFTPYQPVTDIGDPAFTQQFKVYPTLTDGDLFIDSRSSLAAHYEMLTLNGQSVGSGDVSGSHQALNVRGLAAGTYVLRIVSDKGSAVCKFVKQ